MTSRSGVVRNRRRIAIDAAMLFIIILLVVQMWLLTATLESYLDGQHDVALPGLITSALVFAACLGIYLLVRRLDVAPEPEDRPTGSGPWEIG